MRSKILVHFQYGFVYRWFGDFNGVARKPCAVTEGMGIAFVKGIPFL
jgi:hypothetical protein